jgi:hypothetical protein
MVVPVSSVDKPGERGGGKRLIQDLVVTSEGRDARARDLQGA